MFVLVLGMVIFIGTHLFPEFSAREKLIGRIGLAKYLTLFSLLSIIGMTLIVYGKGLSPFIALWQPPAIFRHITLLLMVISLLLITASIIPNNLRKNLKHPMLIGVATWSTAHLLANGDLSSIILFGCFLIFSIFKIISLIRRSTNKNTIETPNESRLKTKTSRILDITTIVAGLSMYGILLYFHQNFTGVPIL